jgi:AraC family transcriptional regulator, ethanolamine operon transcriptional activator
MQIPKVAILNESMRQLVTPNIDELARFQPSKNRRYTQNQPGLFLADYLEINLGDAQLFKESLNVGARIEAMPPSSLIPFGVTLPKTGEYRFCGTSKTDHSIIQASGGTWDILFKDQLEYICTAFSNEYFYVSYELLTAKQIPSGYLASKLSQTSPKALNQYIAGVTRMIETLQTSSMLLNNKNITKLLCSELFTLTLNTLLATNNVNGVIEPHSKRIKGVQRVIDFLHSHVHLLPDMQSLCHVAGLSERSLEYGFKEYLGVTPTRYLRNIRLNQARLELLNMVDKQTKISEVALRWGFLELGRFSGEYKFLFHELPSQTLRNSLINNIRKSA